MLRVIEVGAHVRVRTSEIFYEYEGMTEPNHTCQTSKPLRPGDLVIVKNLTPTSVLVTGPCGCDFLLWGRLPAASGENDSLLDRVRWWMIARFALNTESDLWVWAYIIGVAAHLEYLAFAILWVADQKPEPFEKYLTDKGLGKAARLLGKSKLLDSATVETLKRIAELRNGLAHRGATYGVSFQESDPSRGEYKGRHIFTDPEGIKQLMDDVDGATKVMGEWLRKAGLGAQEGTPT